jgi:hypothetical protein
MKSREIEPEKKFWFIILSVVAILAVGVGWFFSFRNLWQAANLSFGFNKVSEFKQGLDNITSDIKDDLQQDVAEFNANNPPAPVQAQNSQGSTNTIDSNNPQIPQE